MPDLLSSEKTRAATFKLMSYEKEPFTLSFREYVHESRYKIELSAENTAVHVVMPDHRAASDLYHRAVERIQAGERDYRKILEIEPPPF